MNSYFKRLFVNVNVVASLNFLCFAKEDEVFEQEDVPQVFPASAPHYELILAAKLTLLF